MFVVEPSVDVGPMFPHCAAVQGKKKKKKRDQKYVELVYTIL